MSNPLSVQETTTATSNLGTTYTVTNTNDDGEGSLRWAITQSNDNPGTDTILFNIGEGGYYTYTITPLSALPEITSPVFIDGTSQPGYEGTPIIQISGYQAGEGLSGLVISAGDSTVRGLIITQFSSYGISLIAQGNNIIQGNYIGNVEYIYEGFSGNGEGGILIESGNNLIGGATTSERNIVSGNTGTGVLINNETAINNQVINNYIGVDSSGTSSLPNGNGVGIVNGSGNIIKENVIAGNTNTGVSVLSYGAIANNNQILNNWIGTSQNYNFLGNGDDGIDLAGAKNTLVQGNYIYYNQSTGVVIRGADATGNQITNNYLFNNAEGMSIQEQAQGNSITGNQIGYNNSNGISVDNSQKNTIQGNRIYENNGLGIDLGRDGVTTNDEGDSDTGANALQNYPVFTSAEVVGGTATLIGYLNSEANKEYRIEIFANRTQDASGNGEGEDYRTYITVTTDDNGHADFTLSLSNAERLYSYITGTATNPDGNTSEFSPSITLTGELPNLVITDATAPSSVGLGQSFTVNWTVKNQGTVPTAWSYWSDSIVYSSDDIWGNGNDYYLNNFWVDSSNSNVPLEPDETYTMTGNVTLPSYIPATASGYLLLKTDQYNYQAETDETDNDYSIPIAISQPNLIITEVTAPTTATASQTITLSWTGKNDGSVTTGSSYWYDRVVFSKNNIYGDSDDLYLTEQYISSSNGLPLDPNETYTVNRTVTLPSSVAVGSGYLLFKTDAYNYQVESNENDNVYAQAIDIGVPNLIITNVTVPTTASAGQSITLSWTGKNDSSVTTVSSYWYDSVVFSKNNIYGDSDDLYLTEQYISSSNGLPLEPNETYTVNRTVTLPSGAVGSGYLLFKTDAFNYQVETNENDNVYTQAIDIAAPNLIITNFTAPSTASAGQSITLSWTGKNDSSVTTVSSYWYDSVVFSKNNIYGDSDDIYLTEQYISSSNGLPLEPNETYTVNRTVTLPSGAVGSGYLLFKTDAFNYQVETNENDNVYTQAIDIAAPNLIITNFTAPSTASTRQTIALSWTVQNQGTRVTNTSSWYDRIVFSSDTVFGNSDDIYLTEILASTFANLPLDPDETYNVTQNITLPDTVAGNGYLLVKTDNYNGQLESNKTDNIRSVAIAVNAPNLVISNPTSPPSAAVLGQTVPLSWRVTNTGTVSALAGWYDRVYLSNDGLLDSNDVNIGEFYRPNSLAPNASYTNNQNIFLPATSIGDRYLLFVTDVYRGQGETNETDNIIATPITLTAPDLTVTAATAPTTAVTSGTLNVSWTVTNGGDVVASADWSDEVRLSTNTIWGDSDDRSITSGTVSIAAQTPLNPNSSYTIERTVTLPSVVAGNYNLLFRADRSNQQGETNEENNVRSLPIAIAVPDLVVAAATAPTNGIASQSIAVSWTVTNQGTVDAAADWYDSVYLSTNNTFESFNDTRIASDLISTQTPLLAGNSYTFTRNVTLPNRPAGDYFLLFLADDAYWWGNSQRETDENNNVRAVPITIGVPDLTVSAATAPSSGVLGGAIDVSWTVTNTSTVTAPADWSDRIYFSTDEVWNPSSDTLITSEAIATQTPLNAGLSYTVNRTITLPNVASNGSGYLLFVADANANQAESNENNNVRSVPFTLNAPNLTVTGATAPSSVSLGSTIAVTWTVANSGQFPANANWYDSVYLSDNETFETSDVWLGERWSGNSQPIAVGGTYTGTRNITLPTTTTGNRYLLFITDQYANYSTTLNNRQGETNENDNIFALPINISSADLVLESAIAPSGGIIGNPITLSWTVKNQGTGEAPQDWRDYVYLSLNQTLDGSDTLLVNEAIATQTPLAADGSYTINKTVNLASITPGTRYLIFVADGSGNQGEINETNNQRVVEIVVTAPDLIVSTANAPTTAITGSNIAVSWTTSNQGTSEASADWSDAVYLSGDSLLDASDIFITSEAIASQTPLAAGASYTISRNIALPSNVSGDRFLLFVADNSNAQGEVDNTNNVRAVPIGINASAILSFSAATFRVNEDGTAIAPVTIERSGIITESVSVTLNLSNGTAIAGSDYNSSPRSVTFAPGETSKTVTIPIVNDSQLEADETVNLTLSNPTVGAILGTQTTAVLTIINDDLPQPGTISFNSNSYTVNENNGTASITLTRTVGSDGEVSVILTPSNGSAIAGDDYTNSPVTVTFVNGQTSKTVTIPITDDSIYEPTETVNLTISNPTGGATLGTQQTATLSIIDNDAIPGVIQFSNTTYSVNENGTPVTAVTLTRTNGSDGAVSVRINLTNGTATAPSDYNNTAITVNFANGETSKTVTIPIVNDTQFEPNETVNLTLSNPTGGVTLGTQTTAVLTIINDDLPQRGIINLNSSNYTANENGTANITLTRTNGSDGEVSVTLTPSDGTANQGSDYNNSPITVTFTNGQTSKTVTIPVTDDSIYEPTETVNLTLSNPTGGATLGTQQTAILTIIDNDAVPGVIQFSNGTYSINENGTPVTAVTLTRSNGSDGAVSVRINLTNGTATAPSDYNNTPITVNFANGETTKNVTIPIIDDSVLETTETINLTLSNPSNGVTIGSQNSAIVNIIDNDFKPTLTVNIVAEQITEGNTIQGTVTRNTDTTDPLTVTLVSSDNTQLTVPTTVIIPAGSNSVNFNLNAVDDTLIELPKNYTIIATSQGFVSGSDTLAVIDNDSVTLTLTILPPSQGGSGGISENGGKAIATVTRNVITSTPLVVQLSSSDTTEATVPTSVIIAAGQASATFEISAVDDTALDGNQTVTITAKPTYTGTNLATDTGNATTNISIIDNESPTLKVVIDKDVISETGTATATITRNTNTSSDLIVTLNSSDTTEATVPNTVTIPVGQTSATFTIMGVSDGINDGSQTVTITASATGLNSGSDSLEVTDINVPDLVVTQLQGIQPTYTTKQSQFTYAVTNNGIIAATGSWKDRIYLSTDNKLDANDTLLGEFGLGSTENPANLLPGTSYNRTVTYFAPRNPGQYYLIGVTDNGNTVNEGVTIGESNNTTITPVTVTPAYRGTVYTDTETALAGSSVTLRGQALSNSDNSPVAYEFVKVRVENKGNIREFDAFTDGNGNFVRQFTPLTGEAGTYNINAYFPGFASEDSTPEDSFTLLGMRFEQNDQFLTQVSQRITEGTTFNGSVKLQNLSNIGLSGLTANVNGVPSDWTVNVTPEKTSLGGNEEITVNYSINVPDDKWSYYNFSVGLTTTEGVTATLPVRVDVARLLPRLVADTRSLQASMLRGGQTLVEFTVSNQGEVASGQLNIFLPEASWLKSASPVTLPSLNPGQSTKVSLLLQPSATQELTVYNGNVVISGDEASLSLPFNFRAISEAKGNLNISVVDELFFFAEGSPRLENATITLLDPFTGTVISSEKDADGILSKTDLAEGYYKLRVTADNHDAYEQNIYIGAGETENIQAFLSRQTVKYTWTVTPTEIEDKYIITVQSTFETNVPIPTVVIEPLSLDFADLQAVGQVMQIDMKVTNYGLIAANDIALNIGEHPFYKIEPLINGVDILAAKSSITIPVRITRIADFDTLASSGEISTSSGIQVPCSFSLGLSYDYECAGQKIKRAFPIPVLNVEGNCNLSLNPLPFPYPSFGGSNGPGGPRGGPVSGIVIPDFKVTSSDCNPCNEKLKQAVIKCVLDLVGIKEIIKCVPILRNISSGINSTEDLIDTSRTVPTPPPSSFFGCLKGFVKKKIKTPQYIYKCFKNLITACDDLSSSSTLSLASQLGISENYDKPFNLEDLEEQATRFEKINDVFALPFGDEIWLEGEESETLGDWLEAFLAKAEGTNGESLQISETQRQELLALPLPEPITGTDVNKFLDRWNRSIDYWNAGIFDLADVPQGESADFIALDLWEKAVNEASEANNSSLAKGFADLGEEIEASFTELQKALEGDSSGVCAKVKIQIDQEAVMTRAAFLGNLEIENGNPTNLTNLSVILQIKDQNGNIVNDKFGITDPILSNITAVDGTGILTGNDPNTPQNEGIGSAKWTFIPTNLAAPEIPTQYNIGGTLSYLENGKTITVPLLSTPITVFPQAELYLDYFHQRDVFADDPFTDDIVETSVPYSLAVLVRNEGKGDAKNLKITSGQPKIVENEKGLLIDFQIIGSEVNGQGVTPSLTVNFGDIKAGKTAVADWLLKSSLQGKFIDYKATFEHINSLGKAELSLIKEVKIHELIHTVQVNHSNPDNLPDFLVNETFDAQFTPDIIYFSSGGTAPVKAVKNATIDAPPTLNDLTVQISATVENGWTYFRLDEPSDSQFEIVKILRSDGTQISADNIWTTDRTFPATGRPNYENILHFFDNTTAGNTTYTVFYTPGGPSITDIIDVSPDPRATAVNAITVDFSEAIKASSFDYNDLSLTLNNGSNLINSTVTIVSLSPTRYQITGLNTLTNNDGEYNLTVNATGIQDSSGKFGTGSLSESWAKIATGNADTTPPNVTDIVNLLINPRNQPVPSLNVTFSEKIDLSTFTWQDITLTRNNGTNLINNTVTITAINDTTYRINGLSGLTAIDGTYNLTVNGSGIQDLSGNNGTGIQSETWIMDTIAPTIPTNITVTNPLTPSGINIESANIATLQPLTASGQQRINTTNPTISGDLGETGLKVFFYDKTTNTLLQQATVTGTQFSGSLQLPSPGARDIEIRLQDTAGNTSNTTLSLFADISQPVLTQFLNVPTSSANAINSIDVQFSEQINLNTFDKSDITLTRDGVILTLPNTVTVTSLSDTTYRINGLGELTNTPGIYNLKVDATTIQDNAGNSGDAAKNTNFTITSPPTPGITLTQTGGNTTVTEGGNTDTYSLVLKTQPTSDVTITLAGNSQITLNQTTLTFTPTNWNTPQTVTINAVDDTLTEGNHTATITHNISSTDTNYNGLTLPNVIVNIQDNDAEIKGNIWNDIDGNATDNNEPNLSGWTVYLDSNNNNQLDTGETSTQTNANGDYTFNNLRPGNYTVAQVVQNGWKQTYPILNITTTAADIPLTIPTLDLIPTSTNTQTQLNFNTANYIVKEDGTAITEIIINRSGNLAGTVTATLTFTDGTAKGCGCAASSINNDFNYSPITITFAENEISKVIPVQNAILNNPNAIRIRNDNKVEGDEYFTIQLTNPTNGAIIGNQGNATVTIIDDESPNNNPITPPISNPSNTLSTSQNTNATNLINLDDFWSDSRFSNIKGQGQSIVIIDTGADLNHTLFGADANNNGIADKIIYQYDFADNDTDASDKNNHGSHIASIASQIAPDANLIILKVFKDNGSGYFADLEEALQWVNTNANTYNVTSVNLSLGDNQNWTNATGRYGIGDELAAIAGQNILIAAAAGNSFYTFNSSPGLAYPAADPNVISVGAVWADDFGSGSFSNGAKDYTTAADRIASFSQRHPILDVFAPGILISGANATGGTITMGGTSQAVPYISAIATLSQQIAQTYLGRELTLTEFRTLLDTTSNLIIDGDDENDNVTNTGISYPRINALALAESILNLNDSNSGSGVVNPGNNNNNGSNTVTNTVSLVHNVTLTAGQILTGINFGNQQLPSNQPPTLNNINKSGDEDNSIDFSQSDFTSAFNDADGNTLVKIQITFLPNNGVLQLNNTAIALSQEITVSDLNNLTFTPNTNFNGNVSFSWNGFDGTVYADNAATVNITVNPVDDAPTVLNPITDVNVDEDAANTVIDISNVFTDIDNDIALIVKSVFTNDNPGLVTATIVDNQLTLDYQDNKSGTANLTIRGTSNGKTVDDTFVITVNPVNDAPTVLNPITDVNVNEDAENSVINLSNVFSDVDGDVIVKTVFVNDNPGLVTATIVDNQLTLDYQDNKFGTANLTIRGTSNGKTVDDTFLVTVNPVDDAPTVLNPITDVNVDEDAANTVIDISNVFTDIDNDIALIVKSVFTNDNPGLVTATIVDNQLTLDYQDNQSGIANLTIRGTSNGKTVDDTFVVNVGAVDNPPTVLNPITDVNVNEDAENSVINLSNVFSDVDGDVIVKTVFVNDNPGLVTATIVDNQLTLDYQDNQSGIANITIRGTSNGKTVDDTFVVNVGAVDNPPTVLNPITDVNVNEDAENSVINLSNVFSDVDGDVIVKSVFTNDNPGLVTATIVDNQLTLDYQDNQSGIANITIRGTSNGKTVDDTFLVTVNPVDDAPTVLNPITDVNVNEDAENSVINLSNVFTDIDNDITLIVKSVFLNNNPGLVTATILDNQLILDYQDNKFGTANLTIRGTSNGKTVDNTFILTVNPVNDAPTLQQKIANQTATENQPFSFTIPPNTFNDVDGDTLTYTLAIATVLPSGITFDTATGTFSGTPSDTASGIYNLTVIASDSAGETADDSFSLNVLNAVNGSSNSETVNGTSGDDHINAGAGNDTVNGGEGNDILDGGTGNDRLAGGPGDDTYIVDNSRDVVIENAGEGKDTVKSSVNYTLTVNIEDLTLAGNDNTNGTGNNLDNLITGNSGNNLLKGLDGNDTLLGNAGNDTLIGGKGNDILTGGDGSDSFLFGSGAIFNSSDFGVDSISDFIKGSDKIILSKTSFNALVSTPGNSLQAAEFATINEAANELALVGSSNAKIVYNLATGNLFYNQNGATTGLGNGALFANFNGIPVLNENDILIQA